MNEMSDHDLEKLLRRASQPDVPQGFARRLEQRLQETPVTRDNVVPLRTRTTPAAAIVPKKSSWLVGVPFAASLLIGVVLGAGGIGTDYFTNEIDSVLTESALTTGFEEAELAADEEST